MSKNVIKSYNWCKSGLELIGYVTTGPKCEVHYILRTIIGFMKKNGCQFCLESECATWRIKSILLHH